MIEGCDPIVWADINKKDIEGMPAMNWINKKFPPPPLPPPPPGLPPPKAPPVQIVAIESLSDSSKSTSVPPPPPGPPPLSGQVTAKSKIKGNEGQSRFTVKDIIAQHEQIARSNKPVNHTALLKAQKSKDSSSTHKH